MVDSHPTQRHIPPSIELAQATQQPSFYVEMFERIIDTYAVHERHIGREPNSITLMTNNRTGGLMYLQNNAITGDLRLESIDKQPRNVHFIFSDNPTQTRISLQEGIDFHTTSSLMPTAHDYAADAIALLAFGLANMNGITPTMREILTKNMLLAREIPNLTDYIDSIKGVSTFRTENGEIYLESLDHKIFSFYYDGEEADYWYDRTIGWVNDHNNPIQPGEMLGIFLHTLQMRELLRERKHTIQAFQHSQSVRQRNLDLSSRTQQLDKLITELDRTITYPFGDGTNTVDNMETIKHKVPDTNSRRTKPLHTDTHLLPIS